MHQLYSSIKFYPFFILLYLNSCNNQTSENPSNIKPSPNLISFESLNQNSTKLADKNFELIDNSYSGINFKFDLGDFYTRAKEYIFATPMGGVATGDFNGDSLPDIYLTRPSGGNRLYKNLGGFKFLDITESANVDDLSLIHI